MVLIIPNIKAYSLNLEVVFCKVHRTANKAADFIAKYVNRCGWSVMVCLELPSSTRSLVFVRLISRLSLFVWPFGLLIIKKNKIY